MQDFDNTNSRVSHEDDLSLFAGPRGVKRHLNHLSWMQDFEDANPECITLGQYLAVGRTAG